MTFRVSVELWENQDHAVIGYVEAETAHECQSMFMETGFVSILSAGGRTAQSWDLEAVKHFLIEPKEEDLRETFRDDDSAAWEKMAQVFEEAAKQPTTKPQFKVGDVVEYNGTIDFGGGPAGESLWDVLAGDIPVDDKPLREGEIGTVKAVSADGQDLLIEWNDPDRPTWCLKTVCVNAVEEPQIAPPVLEEDSNLEPYDADLDKVEVPQRAQEDVLADRVDQILKEWLRTHNDHMDELLEKAPEMKDNPSNTILGVETPINEDELEVAPEVDPLHTIIQVGSFIKTTQLIPCLEEVKGTKDTYARSATKFFKPNCVYTVSKIEEGRYIELLGDYREVRKMSLQDLDDFCILAKQ